MTVVKLFDERLLLLDLQDRTLELIHATKVIDAIKKLITAHDIIALNLSIQRRFKDYVEDLPWDLAALRDLNHTRIELVLFHRTHFKPLRLIDQYNTNLVSLFKIVQLKHSSFDLKM